MYWTMMDVNFSTIIAVCVLALTTAMPSPVNKPQAISIADVATHACHGPSADHFSGRHPVSAAMSRAQSRLNQLVSERGDTAALVLRLGLELKEAQETIEKILATEAIKQFAQVQQVVKQLKQTLSFQVGSQSPQKLSPVQRVYLQALLQLSAYIHLLEHYTNDSDAQRTFSLEGLASLRKVLVFLQRPTCALRQLLSGMTNTDIQTSIMFSTIGNAYSKTPIIQVSKRALIYVALTDMLSGLEQTETSIAPTGATPGARMVDRTSLKAQPDSPKP